MKIRDLGEATTNREFIIGEGKIIYTSDWGNFKIRKNGKIRLHIGNEEIRCTKIKDNE